MKIQEVSWADSKALLQNIRHTVFIEEQGVPQEEEWDEFDSDLSTRHYLAFSGSEPIATARLLLSDETHTPTAKIGRVAVLKQHRKQGVGKALMLRALADALTTDASIVYVYAQNAAIDFYISLGFSTEGDEFYEAGIPHKKMVYHAVEKRG